MRSSKGEHGPVLIDFLLHINGDVSARVVRVLRELAPRLEVYSIDKRASLTWPGWAGRWLVTVGTFARKCNG